jgi:ABC-2 type transport system permease protein
VTTLSYAASDSATMIRRNFRHLTRYPVTIVMSLGVPVIMLALFAGVFGGTLIAGFGVQARGQSYINYLVPGILLMTVGYGCSTTAVAVNRDMTEGVIDRFRTMAVFRPAVLIGHVVGSSVRTLVSIALVILVATAMGFRPTADPVAWLGVLGVLTLFVLALTWLAVAIGLAVKSPGGTGGFTVIVQVLPFLSSAFVPPALMSGAVRWFARNEPFTPVIDTLRGLLLDLPVGDSGVKAVAWCVGFIIVGFLWSRALFTRRG